MFKRLLVLMMLCGTFLSGYYLGLQPGSPDVFKMAANGYERAAELGKAFDDATDQEGIKALEALTGKQLAGQSQLTERSDHEAPHIPEVVGDVKID